MPHFSRTLRAVLALLVGCGGTGAAPGRDADGSAPPFSVPDTAGDAPVPFGQDVVVVPLDGLVVSDGSACVPFCEDRACGDDGCGGVCGQCGVGTSCQGGVCTSGPVAGPACAEAWPCVEACGGDVGCALGCGDGWPPSARDRLERAITCRDASCSVCEDPQCGAHCLVEQCEQAWLGCFQGDATCADLVACAGSCGDGTCIEACARTGTSAAQLAWYELVFCVSERCATGEPGCEALVTGPGGQCRDALLACAEP